MTQRPLNHVRNNVVGYIALIVAVIGGGGSYAIAATHTDAAKKKQHKPTTVAACASKRSGEMFLHKRGKCARGRHKVTWSIRGPKGARGAKGASGPAGPAGAPAPSIFAAVDADSALSSLQLPAEKGMTVQRVGSGVYTMTITDPTCVRSTNNVPVVTAVNRYGSTVVPRPTGAAPVAYIDNNVGVNTQFTVYTGYMQAGGFTPADVNFDVQDTCVPAG